MRTSISKKLLAGALSVMMVLSLVAPTGAQAASKYSVTGYKTVKAGKTYTYKIKGVKKSQYVKVQRNVSGETVKYNKKKLTAKTKVNGTGKNLTLKVKFSEKNKNYTGKFTVRIYNAKSNKLVKRIVKSVKVKTQKAAKVAVTGVALSTTTPKVGDTITATVAPANATNVTYAWYMGDSAATISSQIADQTAASLTVTKDMLGKFIQVVATGDNNSTANAATVAAVAEADSAQIAITAAKQTGAKTINVTFSGAVTDKDALTVKKGSNEVKIDGNVAYAADFKSADITLADKITAAEYTVTLTPADTKVKATEAKFTGEISELKSIEFMNDYLVMKNNDYAEGYAYVKGVDQFGGKVTLSGLTVNAGVGTFKSYDNSTGKITLVDTNFEKGKNTGAFMLIKEVPVFVQYQVGNSVLTANKTLTVSTRSYVSDIEFGELSKDGKMRDDKLLTITELGSGKYYVPFKKIQDQYGNDLSADDLNEQIKENVLFVIPNKESGAFYVTGNFGTLNGQVILWLGTPKGGARPGTMDLTITGAGGKSFTTPVEVKDDPYIQTLTTVYPELYAGQTESAAFEFSAVDQYGNTISKEDLYVMRPRTLDGGKTLAFGDPNGMTNTPTKITVSGNATFRTVTYDSAKKTFKVTLDASAAKAKDVIVLATTTAGMQVATKSINVGSRGTAAKVKSSLVDGTSTQLSPDGVTPIGTAKDSQGNDVNIIRPAGFVENDEHILNFNGAVEFEDANGNTMVRGQSEKYPYFIDIKDKNVESTLPKPDDNVWATGKYVWSLTEAQVKDGNSAENGTTKAVNLASGATVPANQINVTSDADGVVGYADVIRKGGKADYYVTLYLESGSTYYILDDEVFHVTAVTGVDKKYTINAYDQIYAVPGSGDFAYVLVTATTNSGETYRVSTDRIKVVASGDFVGNGYCIFENLKTDYPENTDGTTEVTVYVDGEEQGTATIKYSNKKPVATSTQLYYDTTAAGFDGTEKGMVGANLTWQDLPTDTLEGNADLAIKVKDGRIDVVKANAMEDTVWGRIKDQYGQVMTNTNFYCDGNEIDGTPIAAGRHTIQFTNGTQGAKFYLTVPTGGITPTVTNTVVTDEDNSVTVTQMGTTTTREIKATINAAQDGKVAVLNTTQFAQWNQNKTTDISTLTNEDSLKTTVTAGTGKPVTLTADAEKLTANQKYFVVYQSDDTLDYAYDSMKSAEAVLTTLNAANTGDSDAIVSGEEKTVNTVNVKGKDQFGNDMTVTATGNNDLTGEVTLKNEAENAGKFTATLDVATAGTLKITITGVADGAEVQTASPADKIVFTDSANGMTYTFVCKTAATDYGATAAGQVDGTVWTCTVTKTPAGV